jgi:hypothetical protein
VAAPVLLDRLDVGVIVEMVPRFVFCAEIAMSAATVPVPSRSGRDGIVWLADATVC